MGAGAGAEVGGIGSGEGIGTETVRGGGGVVWVERARGAGTVSTPASGAAVESSLGGADSMNAALGTRLRACCWGAEAGAGKVSREGVVAPIVAVAAVAAAEVTVTEAASVAVGAPAAVSGDAPAALCASLADSLCRGGVAAGPLLTAAGVRLGWV